MQGRFKAEARQVDAVLTMQSWPLGRFRPYPDNPRIHDDRHVAEIAASMRAFGAVVPILADPDGEIIAGHGRLKAAEQLKLKSLPVVVLEGLSDPQKKALRLADNKITANGRFDQALLKIELQSLCGLEVEFDVEVTGFSTAEIDLALDPAPIGDEADACDLCPEPPTAPVVRRGDLWLLGDHKLVCGDSRQMWTFHRLMRTDEARLVLSDPPFNVSVKDHVGGLGATQHEEFAFASGEMTSEAFTAFLKPCSTMQLSTAWTARSTTTSWTGGTWARCWPAARRSTPS